MPYTDLTDFEQYSSTILGYGPSRCVVILKSLHSLVPVTRTWIPLFGEVRLG